MKRVVLGAVGLTGLLYLWNNTSEPAVNPVRGVTEQSVVIPDTATVQLPLDRQDAQQNPHLVIPLNLPKLKIPAQPINRGKALYDKYKGSDCLDEEQKEAAGQELTEILKKEGIASARAVFAEFDAASKASAGDCIVLNDALLDHFPVQDRFNYLFQNRQIAYPDVIDPFAMIMRGTETIELLNILTQDMPAQDRSAYIQKWCHQREGDFLIQRGTCYKLSIAFPEETRKAFQNNPIGILLDLEAYILQNTPSEIDENVVAYATRRILHFSRQFSAQGNPRSDNAVDVAAAVFGLNALITYVGDKLKGTEDGGFLIELRHGVEEKLREYCSKNRCD